MKIYSACFAILLLLIIAPDSYGCVCFEETPATAFERAKIVFIGKMIEGTEKNAGDAADSSKPKIEAGDVTFEVEAFGGYKGIDKGTITIKVPSNKGTSCGPYGLIPGENYVVYAYADDEQSGQAFYTGACTRTALLSEAKDDVAFLRELEEIGYGTIKGYVFLDNHRIENSQNESYKIPDVKIKVAGPETALTLEIDKSGNFETTGLRAGTYFLTLELPETYESSKPIEEITIRGRPTVYSSLTIRHKGRVSGVVQDGDGTGYDLSSIFLENSTARVPTESPGRDGKFEIRGVPPGDYVLYMELRRSGSYETRKYYYPGTYDRAQAAKLNIGLSDAKDVSKFKLPEEFRVRTVSGTVLYPDGKPVANAIVTSEYFGNLSNSRFSPQTFASSVVADANGRFSLKLIGGTSYVLRAANETAEITEILCAVKTIMPGKNLNGIKLVLSKLDSKHGCLIQ